MRVAFGVVHTGMAGGTHLDRDVALAHAEQLEVGVLSLARLADAGHLDAQKVARRLPVQAAGLHVEQVLRAHHGLGRELRQCDARRDVGVLGAPPHHVRVGGGPLQLLHALRVDGCLAQQPHARCLVHLHEVLAAAARQASQEVSVAAPREVGDSRCLHLREVAQRAAGGHVPHQQRAVGVDALHLAVDGLAVPRRQVALVGRELGGVHVAVAQPLELAEVGAPPQRDAALVKGAQVGALRRPLHAEVDPHLAALLLAVATVGQHGGVLGLAPEDLRLPVVPDDELVTAGLVRHPVVQVVAGDEGLDLRLLELLRHLLVLVHILQQVELEHAALELGAVGLWVVHRLQCHLGSLELHDGCARRSLAIRLELDLHVHHLGQLGEELLHEALELGGLLELAAVGQAVEDHQLGEVLRQPDSHTTPHAQHTHTERMSKPVRCTRNRSVRGNRGLEPLRYRLACVAAPACRRAGEHCATRLAAARHSQGTHRGRRSDARIEVLVAQVISKVVQLIYCVLVRYGCQGQVLVDIEAASTVVLSHGVGSTHEREGGD